MAVDNPVNPKIISIASGSTAWFHDRKALVTYLICLVKTIYVWKRLSISLGEQSPDGWLRKWIWVKTTKKIIIPECFDWLGLSEKNLPEF